MRIAIVGPGGVGGLVAGLLARAGTEVALVARGAALEAIRRDGLSVDSALGAFTVRPAAVADDPAALGRCDAVLVAVKAWQVPAVAPRLAPLVGPDTIVAPLENGVESADRLAETLGEARVVGGLCFLVSWTERPGRVKHLGGAPRITLGERRRPGASPRLERLAEVLRAAGIEVELADDVTRAAWRKFLFIDPVGAVGAVTRAPVGVFRAIPESRALLVAAMEEVVAVARARGVDPGEDAIAAVLRQVDAVPPETTASMQRDLAAGRPSELLDQPGAIARLGRAAGVPTPIHDALLGALLPLERAARGDIPGFPRT